MKVYRHLFDSMISMESLLFAWDEFKKGKGHKLDVQVFERHLEDNLFRLHRDLKYKRYAHGEYSGFYIRDPKIRHIHKAFVRDRIVHHVVSRCLEQIFEPTFISDSYSCRKDKGVHIAVKNLEKAIRKVHQTNNQCYILKCDIKKFFPTIDHIILRQIIARRIKDEDVLNLITIIIGSFASEWSEEDEIKGAPIGNLTSQLFANIYMNELDHYVKHTLRVKYYFRYTDDFVIVHHNREYLLEIKDKIQIFLNQELKLSLHPNKVHLRKYRQGIDFLGYILLPNARVLRTKLRRRIFKKILRRVEEYKSGVISETSLLQSWQSYRGVLSHANCYRLEQELHHLLWESVRAPTRAKIRPKEKSRADTAGTGPNDATLAPRAESKGQSAFGGTSGPRTQRSNPNIPPAGR